jgi:trehalose 6-phosphate phosphatase
MNDRTLSAISHTASHMSRRACLALDNPHRWALFLDIDGTLLAVAPTPNGVSVPPGLVALLGRLCGALGGALALMTGRRVQDADRLFHPLRLVTAGVHGIELRTKPDGPITDSLPPVPPDIVAAAKAMRGLSPGVIVEVKGSAVAVHYRNAPEARPAIETELKRVVANSGYDLVLHRGRKVIEILPRGVSKGGALVRIHELPPFRERSPIMIGDDAGDETALATAERLGGLGLKVAGEHFAKESADFDGVRSVRAWLEALAEGLEARPRR